MAALIKSAGYAHEPFVLDQKPAEAPSLPSSNTAFAQTFSAPDPLPQMEEVPAKVLLAAEVESERPDYPDFDSVLRAHQQEIDAMKADAVARGYAEGLDAGRMEGKKTYLAAQRKLESTVDALGARFEEVVDQAEALIGEIVFSVVARIVGAQITSADGVRALVAEAIAQVRRQQIIRIRMTPGDIALLQETEADGESQTAFAGIPIEPDDEIGLGGCVIDIEGGSLDARIETQFRQFAQSLKDLRARK